MKKTIRVFAFIASSFLLYECSRNESVSPVDQATEKSDDRNARYQPYVDPEFCPWCMDIFITPGTGGFPPIGAPSNPPNNPAPGNPTASWTIDNYRNDPRYQAFVNQLNPQEVLLFAASPWRIPAAQGNRWAAVQKAEELYFEGNFDNTNANAFKHAYWSKLNALSFGAAFAKQMGDAHEYYSPPASKEMDLHNNKLGYEMTGTLHGWPPPGRPENLYFVPNILRAIAAGQGKRLADNDPVAGLRIKTDGTGRR